jgi:hypothetical protein
MYVYIYIYVYISMYIAWYRGDGLHGVEAVAQPELDGRPLRELLRTKIVNT